LRCNNIGSQQQQQFPSNNIFTPFQQQQQQQQPAWVFPYPDEQPYSVPTHQTNKFVSKLKTSSSSSSSMSSNINSGYRVKPSYAAPTPLSSKCFHHPSTPQYQPPHLRRPIRLTTSDSCEHLANEDPWNIQPQFDNETFYSRNNFYPSYQGSSDHLNDHLMPPPPERFDSSPVGEAVTRFDCDYSDQESNIADKIMSSSLISIKSNLKSNQCSMSQSSSSNFMDKSTVI
jgi:hypothetical protein